MKPNERPARKTANLPEKVIVAVLSVILFSGSVVLYVRDSRPLAAITVERGGIKENLTLQQVEARLKEAAKIRINSATVDEMTLMPGIGPAIASRIEEYRELHGRFHSVDSLLKVRGVGPVKLEKMKEYVNIE